MLVQDFTSLLKLRDDYHVFNPSLIEIPGTDNLFLVAFRICSYDSPVALPPWKVWNDGYKYFKKKEEIIRLKYKDTFGPARTVPFHLPMITYPSPEYDTTGLAILKFIKDKISLVAINLSPFKDEMIQDARLTLVDGKIRISYNVFNTLSECLLRWRSLSVNTVDWVYEYSEELDMFKHFRKIEKNCIFFKDRVIYSIDSELKTIDKDQNLITTSTQIPCFPGVLFSSSASPVPYRGNFLGVGHIKVEHKDNPLLNLFLGVTDMSQIVPHSRYFYFIFLYEITGNYEFLRISVPFVPTEMMDTRPHILAMPMGICNSKNRYIISYGEGDCRCKLLKLGIEEIDHIFSEQWHGSEFYYLSSTFTLNHFGYFHKRNTGDDCFELVFKWLKSQYYPHAQINFVSPSSQIPEADLTILGGGDVINTYFLNHLNTDNVLAVSVGIPYEEFEDEVKRFKITWLRDQIDAEKLGVNFVPDLAFFLPSIFPEIKREAPRKKSIGISVLRTYYNPQFPEIYHDYVCAIREIVKKLLSENFSVVLIPFGVNENKPNENDMITCREIKEVAETAQNLRIAEPCENNVREVYKEMSKLDFMICARFHSHIFATALNLPFVSVTLGRKSVQFMKMTGLIDNLYKLKANEIDLPIDIEPETLFKFIKGRFFEREKIEAKLKTITDDYRPKLNNFIKEYLKAILENVQTRSIELYPKGQILNVFLPKTKVETLKTSSN